MGFLSMRSLPKLANTLKITEKYCPDLQAQVNEAIHEESRYEEILQGCIDSYLFSNLLFKLFITFFYILLHRNVVVSFKGQV